jgi:hypothetical protein
MVAQVVAEQVTEVLVVLHRLLDKDPLAVMETLVLQQVQAVVVQVQ